MFGAMKVISDPPASLAPRRQPAGVALGLSLVDWLVAVSAAVLVVVLAFTLGESEGGTPLWLSAAVMGVAGVAGMAGAIVALRAQAALRRQRHLLERLGEGRGIATLLVGPDRQLSWSNASARELLRISESDPVASMAAQLGDRPGTAEALDRLTREAAAGRAATAEVAADNGEGGVRYLAISCEPLGLSGTIWRIDDISERRRQEAMSNEAQIRLRAFVDEIPLGLYSVDAEGHLTIVNQALASWLEMTPAEITQDSGQRLRDLVSSALPASTPPYDPFGKPGVVATGTMPVQSGEVMLRKRSGRTLHAHITQQCLSDAQGGLHVTAVVRDMGAERDTLQALLKMEERTRRFFEEAPLGIAIVDGAGLVVDSNRAFRLMAGLPEGERGAHRLTELIRADQDGDIEGLIQHAVAVEHGGQIEVRLSGRRDTIASLFASRLEQDDSGEAGVVLYFLDVTEQRHLEYVFTQSQKMQAVGQLAGGIAHDFNNLLTAMIGFCDLLLLRHQMGDPSFADIMQIRQNANRAANLVRQLLAFSRQQRLQPKVLNITDALAELSHLLRRLIGENLELKMTHGRDLFPVRVDQGQLEQVIMNLAVNARDAMPKGGQLTIRTANQTLAQPQQRGQELLPAGDYVLIEVADTGMGIAKEHIVRIFDPFFSTKEVGSGTGLGLSTVYGIVKQTGGFIVVESEVGKGATFSIFLPRWLGDDGQVAGKPAAQPEVRKDLTGAGSILLVEDEDAVRLFSARALRNKGYKVVEAKSGEQAVEVLRDRSHKFDLMITDVVMPQMDGATLIRIVREQLPDLKVICISGYAEEAVRKRLDTDAADIAFLPKPFSLDQLAGQVKEALRGGS